MTPAEIARAKQPQVGDRWVHHTSSDITHVNDFRVMSADTLWSLERFRERVEEWITEGATFTPAKPIKAEVDGYPFKSVEQFASLLSAHGLLDECAYWDAEGYDGGKTVARIERMMDAIKAVRGESEVCRWSYDDSHDKHDTGCKRAFQLWTGGAEDNGYNFCPNCGKRIEASNFN